MKIRMRALKNEEGKRFIEGYASLFNVQSRMLHENGKTFREVIRDGAFDGVLAGKELNVIANIDHDMSRMLGRSTSGTLKLTVDAVGLRYSIEVPNTQLGNDTYEQVERGDLYESSFAFGTRNTDVDWGNDRSDGMLLRFVNNVTLLRDISIVRNGAYGKTDVETREYQEELRNNIIMEDCDGTLCRRVESDVIGGESIKEVDEAKREESVAETTKVETTEDIAKDKPEAIQEKQEVKSEPIKEVEKPKEVKVEKPAPVIEGVVEDQNDQENYEEFVNEKYNEISNLVEK